MKITLIDFNFVQCSTVAETPGRNQEKDQRVDRKADLEVHSEQPPESCLPCSVHPYQPGSGGLHHQ